MPSVSSPLAGESGSCAGKSPAEIAKKVQSMYATALKTAKTHLKQGNIPLALDTMADFFDYQEDLAQYFHHRTVEEVSEEMLDRLEQARSSLASIFAEKPDIAKQFLQGLKSMVEAEFDAFKAMKAEQENESTD